MISAYQCTILEYPKVAPKKRPYYDAVYSHQSTRSWHNSNWPASSTNCPRRASKMKWILGLRLWHFIAVVCLLRRGRVVRGRGTPRQRPLSAVSWRQGDMETGRDGDMWRQRHARFTRFCHRRWDLGNFRVSFRETAWHITWLMGRWLEVLRA